MKKKYRYNFGRMFYVALFSGWFPLTSGVEQEIRENIDTSPVPLFSDRTQFFYFKTGIINSNYFSSANIKGANNNASAANGPAVNSTWFISSFVLRFSPASRLSAQLDLPIINIVEGERNESAFAGIVGSVDWSIWQNAKNPTSLGEFFLNTKYSLLSTKLEQLFTQTLLLKQQDQLSLGLGYKHFIAPVMGQFALNINQSYSINAGFFYYPIVSPELQFSTSFWPDVITHLKTTFDWTLGPKSIGSVAANNNSISNQNLVNSAYWNFVITPSISFQLTKLMQIDLTFMVPLAHSLNYNPKYFSNPLVAGLWGGQAELGIKINL